MITAAGIFNLAIAVFHALFWRLFRWPESLAGLNKVNGAILQLENIFLTVFFVIVGLAMVLFPTEIANTALGRFLLAAMVVLWALRLAMQPVFLGWSDSLSVGAIAVIVFGIALHVGAFVGVWK